MKFESKAHMAQELAAGKRYSRQFFGDVIYFDSSKNDPFRVDSSKDKPYPVVGARMVSTWDDWDKDIWEEIKPRHVHQDLIDSYQEGQAWQYTDGDTGWMDCKSDNVWVIPEWNSNTQYRLHPHNELIQAHRNGAEIQCQEDCTGDWVDITDPINWYEDTQYRIKTRHIHQDLIDSYKPGQAWQFKQNRGDWEDCIHDKTGLWFQPTWRTNVDYRLHPHNELIQAHRNGAEIQYYTHGDDEYCWVDDPTPCWDTYLMYRIKPKLATLYEWMVRKHGAWHVQSELCTESEAPSVFSAGYIVEYRKTGRSWQL